MFLMQRAVPAWISPFLLGNSKLSLADFGSPRHFSLRLRFEVAIEASQALCRFKRTASCVVTLFRKVCSLSKISWTLFKHFKIDATFATGASFTIGYLVGFAPQYFLYGNSILKRPTSPKSTRSTVKSTLSDSFAHDRNFIDDGVSLSEVVWYFQPS